MRTSALLMLTAVLAGCGKKSDPTPAGPPPEKPGPVAKAAPAKPDPAPGPMAVPGKRVPRPVPPVEKLTYDPAKPDLRLDLDKGGTDDLGGKVGQVVEARGKAGNLFARGWADEPGVRRPAFSVFGQFGHLLTCVPHAPLDWRKVTAGKTVTVVGVLAPADGRGVRLKDVVVTASAGPDRPEAAAEELGGEYAADPAGFEKKHRDKGFRYVTGVLKSVDENTISKTAHAYKFVLAGGPVEVHCFLQNERDVDAAPPADGQKVVLLAEVTSGWPGFKGVTMSGAYLGTAP